MRRALLVAVLGLALLPLSCGDDAVDGPPSPGGAGAAARAAGSTGGAAGTPGGPECPPPGYATDPPQQPVASVQATLVDEQGAAVAEVPVQVCGLDLCLIDETNASGSVLVEANTPIQQPAFKVGDGIVFAKYALPLPAETTVHDLGMVPAISLPPAGEASALEAGASVASSGVTLELASDLSLFVDPLDYPEDERGFRAVEVSPERLPWLVDEALGPQALFALSPAGATLCPAGALSVPNTLNLEPGAEVEFYLHGVRIEEEFAPYAGWAKVSDGEVTADGAQIMTAADGGLPELGLLAVRPKE